MSFATTFAGAFYQGSAASTLVPGTYMHALDGHPFPIDRLAEGDAKFRHVTIPLLKQQQQADSPLGARSINPNGLWRSSVESWHKGAGQKNFDLDASDPYRFRMSKGVDPWTRWQLSLLPDTSSVVSSSNTNLRLAATSTRLFWLDGTAIKYTDDLSSVSTMTGTKNWVSITSNGYDVWATDASDVYHWVRTATSVGSAWNTTDVDLLVWVRGKGRLIGSKANVVYNIIDSSTFTAITPSIISTDFTWVGFAEGPSVIYGAGYQGNKSMIFRWGVKSDGTIDVAIPALTDGLPDGEIVYSIDSYLGFVLIGTDQGVRFAIPDKTTGNLTVGSLIDIDTPVRDFEGQGSQVRFGWTNYDTTSTGLGRLSLTTFTDTDNLVPAYASDLMVTGQGNVLSIATFSGYTITAVSGLGIYKESTNKVASGTLTTGWRSFGIPDNKVALVEDIRHDPLPAGASVATAVAVDGGAIYSTIMTSSITSATGMQAATGEVRAERFEAQFTLTRATATTTGPTLTREVLYMNPTADTGFMIIVPFMLNAVDQIGTTNIPRDPVAELGFLEDLRASRDVVVYQEGSRSLAVSLEDFLWLPTEPIPNPQPGKAGYQGTCVCQLKVV